MSLRAKQNYIRALVRKYGVPCALVFGRKFNGIGRRTSAHSEAFAIHWPISDQEREKFPLSAPLASCAILFSNNKLKRGRHTSREQTRVTVLHELAHHFAGDVGHNRAWFDAFVQLCDPTGLMYLQRNGGGSVTALNYLRAKRAARVP